MQRFIISLFIWLLFFQVVRSQDVATFSVKKTKLKLVLKKIEKEYNVKFAYQVRFIQNKKIQLQIKQANLDKILRKITMKTGLIFKKIDNRYYSVLPRKQDFNIIQKLPVIQINGYLTNGITKTKESHFTIKPNKIGLLAGLTEADVFESLQQFPAVTNPNETATQILVRGGNSDQNNILFDEIPIYHKGHLYGMISPINPNIVNTIHFYAKASNPRYNERVSSVILVKSNEKINKKNRFIAGFNGTHFDISAELPILKNKLQIQASVRRSFTELLETPTYKAYENKIFQSTKINDSKEKDFYFTDYFFKINYTPNSKNRFLFSTIFIDNNLNFNLQKTDNNNLTDALKIYNNGFSFKWEHIWNSKLTQTIFVNLSDYNLKYKQLNFQNSVLTSDFKKQNQVYDTGLTSEFNYFLNKKINLSFGYQFNLKNASYAFVTTENNNNFVLDSENKTANKQAVFGNFTFKNKKYFVSLGTNITHFLTEKHVKIAPRILVSKSFSKYFKLVFTTEFKNQNIYQIDETVLSDLTLDNRIWRVSNNDDAPIINGKQYTFGTVFKKNKWTFDLDFYSKHLNGLTALSLGYLNPENPNFNIGEQKNTGVEFYTKKEFNNLNFWLSYGFSNIQNKFENINQNQYFTASNEIKHNGTFSVSYVNNQLEVAATWFIRSGKPYTKATLDQNNNFVFNRINTLNLPVYHRLDISSTYKFSISKNNKNQAKIGFSIRNLYNQKNFISKEYIGNNSLTQPIRELDFYGISFTPNVLFRIWF